MIKPLPELCPCPIVNGPMAISVSCMMFTTAGAAYGKKKKKKKRGKKKMGRRRKKRRKRSRRTREEHEPRARQFNQTKTTTAAENQPIAPIAPHANQKFFYQPTKQTTNQANNQTNSTLFSHTLSTASAIVKRPIGWCTKTALSASTEHESGEFSSLDRSNLVTNAPAAPATPAKPSHAT
jgi:hypothetical protein